MRRLSLTLLLFALIQTGSQATNAFAPSALRDELVGGQGVAESYRRLGESVASSVGKVGSSIKKSAKGQPNNRQRPGNREKRKR
ncbi:hypothetical protein BH20ACI3_BH20ACI3_34540 [soil metagenome]